MIIFIIFSMHYDSISILFLELLQLLCNRKEMMAMIWIWPSPHSIVFLDRHWRCEVRCFRLPNLPAERKLDNYNLVKKWEEWFVFCALQCSHTKSTIFEWYCPLVCIILYLRQHTMIAQSVQHTLLQVVHQLLGPHSSQHYAMQAARKNAWAA